MQSDFVPADDPSLDPLFLSANAKRARGRTFRESAIEVLPGIFSDDPLFLEFKHRLSHSLTDKFPSSVDSEGKVSGNGVRSNFLGLRHVNGFPMIPATYPLVSNEALRREKGLASAFVEDWHGVVFRAFVRAFYSGLEPTPMRLRNGSSSVIPYFTTNMTEKKEESYTALTNMRRAGELLLQGRVRQAWDETRIGGAYYAVYRRQSSDGVEFDGSEYIAKTREVSTLQHAISGGLEGAMIPASKEAPDHIKRKGFFRERNRTAMGGPLGLNSCIMLTAQPAREALYDRYPYTYHHTTRLKLRDEIRKWSFMIAADVTAHDQLWPTWMGDVKNDELRRIGYADWYVALLDHQARMPIFASSIGPNAPAGMMGDWERPNSRFGLSSGVATTDLDGSLVMSFVYFLIQVEHTYPRLIVQLKNPSMVDALVYRYLRGELPIVLKDKSDDALLGWTSPELIPAARQLLQKMQDGDPVSPYMEVTYEDGYAFLGGLILFPEDGSFSTVEVIGNIQSMVVNEFSPEYGVQSTIRDRSRVKRPFPGLAWASLRDVYGTSPIYGEVREMIERTWRDVYGYSYNAFRESLLVHDQRQLARYVASFEKRVAVADLTQIDLEVLADPDKVQYKFSPKDVNPAVLDSLFRGHSVAITEKYFSEVFK